MAWYRVDRDGGPDTCAMQARECAAAAVCKGKVLITHGNDASTRFKDILEFDPVRLTIQKNPAAQNPDQIPLSAHTFTSCDQKHFFQFGGWDGGRDISSMYRFDADTKTWSVVQPNGQIPSARHFHACTGLGDRVILFGGYDGARWTNDLYSFAPATNTWRRETTPVDEPAPVARASHHCVALDSDRMVMFAGFDGSEFLSDLWMLHTVRSPDSSISYRWERIDRATPTQRWAESRSGGGMVAYKNLLIVYGGRCRRDGKVAFSDRVEVFSLEDRQWREVPSTGAVPPPRKCFACAQINNKFFIFGGLGAHSSYYRDVHCLDLDSVVAIIEEEQCRIPVPPSTFALDLQSLLFDAFKHVMHLCITDGAMKRGEGDLDASFSGPLTAIREGYAYTEEDFQTYFAEASGTPVAQESAAVHAGAATDGVVSGGEGVGPGGGDSAPLHAIAAPPLLCLPRRDQPALARAVSMGSTVSDRNGDDEDAGFGDVTFQLEGQRIQLHKVILATRCEYFRIMLSSRWLPSGEGMPLVSLEDISLRTFWQIAHYLYLDGLPSDFDVAEDGLELVAQAQKFDLTRLSFICQRMLECHIGEDSVCDLLRQADLLHAMALRLACINFILDNFERVSMHPAFIALPENVIREVLVRRSKKLSVNTRMMSPTTSVGGASIAATGFTSPLGSPMLSPTRPRWQATRITPRSQQPAPLPSPSLRALGQLPASSSSASAAAEVPARTALPPFVRQTSAFSQSPPSSASTNTSVSEAPSSPGVVAAQA